MEAKIATVTPLGQSKAGGGQKLLKQARMDKIRLMKRETCEAHLHTIFAGENMEGEIL